LFVTIGPSSLMISVVFKGQFINVQTCKFLSNCRLASMQNIHGMYYVFLFYVDCLNGNINLQITIYV